MAISAAVCPSGDERVTLFALLLDTNARLAKSLGAELEENCQLPLPWFEVLLRLRRSDEGNLTMSQIADAIVHSTGGTTRLVDRIEAAGLVSRRNCDADRRTVRVAITAQGNEKLDEALSTHLAFLDSQVFHRLDTSERSQLAGLLKKLNECD